MAECNTCLTESRLLKLYIAEDLDLFLDFLSEYKPNFKYLKGHSMTGKSLSPYPHGGVS
jgi:hypothetical protein